MGKDISGESWYKDISSGSGKKYIVMDGLEYYAAYKNTGSKTISAVLRKSGVDSYTGEARNRSLIISIAAVVFMGIAIILLSGSITRPVKNMSEKVQLISSGNLDIELGIKSNDELGQLARDFDNLRQMLKKLTLDINEMNREHVNKNYGYVIDDSIYYGGFKIIVDIINSMAQHRANESHTLRSAIENLNNSIQEIDDNIKSNASAAKSVRDVSAQAADYANISNEKMEEMTKSINEINESSQNLSKTIKAINSVSSQTRMMAINAAIEAVKAGEAGKGFSALADQISDLATKSEASIKDSTKILEVAKVKVHEGNEITSETVGVIQEMISQILVVSEYVNKITQASVEQERSIENVRDNVSKIARIMDIV
jgi:methyl-accepting chemotaxis protein